MFIQNIGIKDTGYSTLLDFLYCTDFYTCVLLVIKLIVLITWWQLLNRYDKGVWLDEESWYSITPQATRIFHYLT